MKILFFQDRYGYGYVSVYVSVYGYGYVSIVDS